MCVCVCVCVFLFYDGDLDGNERAKEGRERLGEREVGEGKEKRQMDRELTELGLWLEF